MTKTNLTNDKDQPDQWQRPTWPMTKTKLTNDKDQPRAAVDERGEREEDCGEGLSHRPHPGKQSTTVVKAHKFDVFNFWEQIKQSIDYSTWQEVRQICPSCYISVKKGVSVIMIKILKDILEVKKSQSRVHIEIIISQLSSLLCRERPLMPLILFYPSGFRRRDAFYKFSHTLAIFTLGQKHIFNIFRSTLEARLTKCC